jgi:hypothetical protein
MAVSTLAGLKFPCSRVVLPRTRLAYINLRNLLTDAKRDRSARISGYVAITMPEEMVVLYLLGGELVNATVRDSRGGRPVAIASALELVPSEPEYGDICFNEADEEQLACMYATYALTADPWPPGMQPADAATLFPYLMSTTFDGFLEIINNDHVNYLIFENGSVPRAFLASVQQGTLLERVKKLFAREGRVGELRVCRWGVPAPLPVQAPPALVQAYRDLTSTLVKRLVAGGRDAAPAIAEQARQNLLSNHPVLDGFSFSGRPAKEPVSDTAVLTAGVAAWIRDLMWAAVDQEATPPEALLREITWERRHIFQSAGLYDEIPWKVI